MENIRLMTWYLFITFSISILFIQRIEACPVADVPLECTCVNTSSVWDMTCNMADRTQWIDFPYNMTHITFNSVTFTGSARIQIITKDALQHIKTKNVHFNNIGITSIHHAAFDVSQTEIETIDFDNNNLDYFPVVAINNLRNPALRVFIRHNDISLLQRTYLPDNVIELQLSGNLIRNIDIEFFRPTNMLRIFNISHNMLKNTDIESAKVLTNLELLDMSYNQIKTLTGALKSKKTRQVNLEHNQISHIDDGFFGQGKVQVLNLNNNLLTDVTGLSALGQLVRLHLGYNLLKTISLEKLYKTVLKNKGFHHLEMQNNSLTGHPTLTKMEFKLCERPDLFALKLDNNELKRFPNIILNGYGIPDCMHNALVDLSNNKLETVPNIEISDIQRFETMVNMSGNSLQSSVFVTLNMNYGTTGSSGLNSESVRLLMSNNDITEFSIKSDTNDRGLTYSQRSFQLYVDLKHNKLSSIPIQEFISRKQRDKMTISVDLSDNEIPTLNDIKDNIKLRPKPKALLVNWWVNNNPLHCDCSMTWIRNSEHKTLSHSTCQSKWCGYYTACFPLENCIGIPSTQYYTTYCSRNPKDNSMMNKTCKANVSSNTNTSNAGTIVGIVIAVVVIIVFIVLSVVYIFRRTTLCNRPNYGPPPNLPPPNPPPRVYHLVK